MKFCLGNKQNSDIDLKKHLKLKIISKFSGVFCLWFGKKSLTLHRFLDNKRQIINF